MDANKRLLAESLMDQIVRHSFLEFASIRVHSRLLFSNSVL